MPLRGILNAAHGLAYYSRLQEVTANNLANASSDGFKLDRMTGRMLAGDSFPVPVQHVDLRQGVFRQTGRALDVALEGEGFLVVKTPGGDRLVRGGSLRLDAAGQLTDSDGNAVLGTKGPIVAGNGTIEFQADGTVLVDGAPIDQLRMETVADLAGLRKEGSGRFLPPEGAALIPAGSLALRQGQIEEPNGDAVLGMVDLVTIQRAYAANVDALKAMDGVLGTIAGDIGRVV
ncbi:MAG TPA: flagellar hook basal-body protein [Gemmatimonadales bacterium]|nr:flagellar hook basal-body protein [Gemmatimonadales bacterium]